MSVEEGQAAARAAGLNVLASMGQEIGDMSRVRRVVKLLGMVNSTPELGYQPKVIKGAPDLLARAAREFRAGIVAAPSQA